VGLQSRVDFSHLAYLLQISRNTFLQQSSTEQFSEDSSIEENEEVNCIVMVVNDVDEKI
jgi:hypothetical protein